MHLPKTDVYPKTVFQDVRSQKSLCVYVLMHTNGLIASSRKVWNPLLVAKKWCPCIIISSAKRNPLEKVASANRLSYCTISSILAIVRHEGEMQALRICSPLKGLCLYFETLGIMSNKACALRTSHFPPNHAL